MSIYPGFVGPSYVSQSPIADGEDLVNWYPERVESAAGRAQIVYYPTPGVQAFATDTQSPVRGLFAQSDQAWAVNGTHLREIDARGTITDRGTVLQDSNPATMTTNGDGGMELFVSSGDEGYVLNLSTNVLTNPVHNVTFGGMVNGYFLALDANSSTLSASDLLDGTTWDPTMFAQRSDASDPWISMLIANRQIWLFGEKTSVVWWNSGNGTFPFEPFPGADIPYGIKAPFSAARLGTSPVWLSANEHGDGIVVRANGYTPEPISTRAVETAIASYSRIDDAIGMTYQDKGHVFYCLTFPTANATWVYDATENLWHKRSTWDSAAYNEDAWRPQFFMAAFDKLLVGDSQSGVIYAMNTALGSDVGGGVIRRRRRAPALAHDNDLIVVSRFEVLLESGLGLANGQGSNPLVEFRSSWNGGKTWSNLRMASAGAVGAYDTRVVFRNCGAARAFVPEIVVSDPVPWRVVNAFVEAG